MKRLSSVRHMIYAACLPASITDGYLEYLRLNFERLGRVLCFYRVEFYEVKIGLFVSEGFEINVSS